MGLCYLIRQNTVRYSIMETTPQWHVVSTNLVYSSQNGIDYKTVLTDLLSFFFCCLNFAVNVCVAVGPDEYCRH